MTTLADQWQQRQAEAALAAKVPAHVQAKRDFYAGALAAARMPPHDVIRECLEFAKTIGRQEEAA